jgi:acetyl esterase/lipase
MNNLTEVSYGEHPSQNYIYQLPAEITAETRILFYFHGGGWRIGHNTSVPKYIRDQVDSDTIFISVEYRRTGEPNPSYPDNSPDVSQQDILDDAISAINHATSLAASVGIPTGDITISGASAGAWISSNVLTNPERINEYDSINKAILLSGVYDSDPYFEITEGNYDWIKDPGLFDWYNNWVGGIDGTINAIDNICSISPDIVIDIQHGAIDTITPIGQADDFVEALINNGNTVDYTVYEESGHGLSEFYINGETRSAFEALITIVGRDIDQIAEYFDKVIIIQRDYEAVGKDIFDFVDEINWTDYYYGDSSQESFVNNVWYNFSGYEANQDIRDYYIGLLNDGIRRSELMRPASRATEVDTFLNSNTATLVGIYESNIDLF